MAESIQLKPCPFCGGKAGIHRCADLENERMAAVMTGKYGVHCKECKTATTPYDTEEKAVEAWNKRKRSEVLTESMIETIENPKQTLDNMGDPLEQIKVVSAMKSQSMVLEYRQKHEPDKVNILDYTVIAALWKQIPRKVEITEHMTYPERVAFGNCPVCNKEVNQTKQVCDCCGQALAWDKNDET